LSTHNNTVSTEWSLSSGIATWDSRLKQDGGQRWFHLTLMKKVDFENPLHWTGAFFQLEQSLRWCHSTNLNYSFAADTTPLGEISVAYESLMRACFKSFGLLD
jgi:hypothetical protein